ncbi:MAG TPA: caspase family protein [Candidatus Ornithospirochaeta avicola]|uniref:Type IV secretion system putative lipoprotein virB7 n=1 Tax=Candidatus Ornithospirochaeta avicola TaxID=2840896 RepID=A0A9D1PVJ0_9SPIO|nr:caspase family protein [Candidatus Ornithospirochaeta avicola]
MKKIFFILLALVFVSSCSFAPLEETSGRKYHIISIAASYEKAGEKINTLKATVPDQEKLTAQLELVFSSLGYEYDVFEYNDEMNEDYIFSYRYYSSSDKEENIKPFNPGKKTEEASELFEIIKDKVKADKDDVIIFYYAGHGTENGDLAFYYDNSSEHSYSIMTVRMLLDDFLSSYDCTKLVILDSCYSGTFVENSSLESVFTYTEKDGEWITDSFPDIGSLIAGSFTSTFMSNAKDEKRTYILSGSSEKQLSYESTKEDGHGFLTIAVLEALGYNRETEKVGYPRWKSLSCAELYRMTLDNMGSDILSQSPLFSSSRFDTMLFI